MTEEDVGMTEEAYGICAIACDCPERGWSLRPLRRWLLSGTC